MSEINTASSQNVGRNLSLLLDQTGITILGFSYATGISLNHARVIKSGKASITLKTAEKIASFFQIEPGRLFLEEPIYLMYPINVQSIARFYHENESNKQFFVNRIRENSLTIILRNKLIPSVLFNDWVRSKEIMIYLQENKIYSITKSTFEVKAISKALNRIYFATDLLEREDFRKNGKVFRYRRKQ